MRIKKNLWFYLISFIIVLITIIIVLTPQESLFLKYFSNIAETLSFLLASLLLFYFSFKYRNYKIIFLLQGIGFIFWVIGQLLYTYYDIKSFSTLLSFNLCDPFFLLFYFFIFLSFYHLIKKYRLFLETKHYLITINFLILSFLITIYYIFQFIDYSSLDKITFIINALYPLLDILLLSMLILIYYLYKGGKISNAWRYYIIGFLMLLISDLLYFVLLNSSISYFTKYIDKISILWIISPLIIIIGVLNLIEI